MQHTTSHTTAPATLTTLFFCDHELRSKMFTCERDLVSVKMNLHAKYLGQCYSVQKVIVNSQRQVHTLG